ncbi:MAG: hypothetical protein ACXVH1_30405 [Solirubrobacteraceae bacterium]
MPKKTTVAKAGGKGAAKVARNRTARRAVKPAAKASWFVGKKVAKRKVSRRARRYGDTARTARSAALIYGPMVAKALGLVERPKPRRRFPAFLAGIAVGAGLMYLAGRDRTV